MRRGWCSCKECRRIVRDYPAAERATKSARGAAADRGQIRLGDTPHVAACGTLWGIPEGVLFQSTRRGSE